MKNPLRLSFLALLVWLGIATFLAKPPEANLESTLIIAVIKMIPLTIFSYAIWKEKAYGLLALTLVLMIYMGFATMDLFRDSPKPQLALVSLGLELAVCWFSLRVVKRQPRGQGSL